MNLRLERRYLKDAYTIGNLFIDGDYFCDTLEDTVRDVKVQNETAIPYGIYRVVMDFSPRFKRILPHICDVPGFEGVRIHPGNTAADTEGCVLVGRNTEKGALTESRSYSDKLNEILSKEHDITIEIV